jgi:heptosyltransferase-2
MQPIRIDCRHYTGDKPCQFHKKDGRPCAGCADYDAIRVRLLIIKLAAVGDVLRTTSLVPAMKRAYPGAHVTWITDRAAAPVLAGHPLIDRVLTSDACLPALLTERFDVVYGLDADAQSAALSTLARGERKLGYVSDDLGRVVPAGESATDWWLMGLDDRRKAANRKSYQQLMYELCELPGAIDRPHFEIPPHARMRASWFMRQQGIDRYRVVLGLNTGGGRRWAQKKWTIDGYEGFIALTRIRHPEAAIVLLGGPEEEELNARLMSMGLEGVFDAGCSNSVADFAALVAALSILVSSDSLGLHIALAVGTPAVVFVGPTSQWELELYGEGAVVHAEGVACIGCYRAQCDKPVTCMERLDPGAVLAATEPFLAPPRTGTLKLECPHVAAGIQGDTQV